MLNCPKISSKVEGIITKVQATHINISINKSDNEPTIIKFNAIYKPEDYLSKNLLRKKVGQLVRGVVVSFGEGNGLILELQ